MRFENTSVYNLHNAILGARNPLESWKRSDSVFNGFNGKIENTVIGAKDLELMQRLIKAGSEHRKFMRQITISVDITAPSYYWAELDTYKIGVTRNSTSMQHKGVSHRYTIDDFEVENEVREVLSEEKSEKPALTYPYETEEYRIYTCENGRKYKVFKNGKLFAFEYDLTDSTGRTRHFEEREVVPSVASNGYFEVNIGGRNGEKWLIHRLVAFTWLDNPKKLETVDHKNFNKGDNSVENLEWVSRYENIRREWEHFEGYDLRSCYKRWKSSSKLNPIEKSNLRKEFAEGMKQVELAEKYCISQSQVSSIVLNKDNSENFTLFEICYFWEKTLEKLNYIRDLYLETKDYKYFRMIRQIMPMGYLYKSTVTMNYENILTMIKQRRNHSLTEWSVSFIEWAKTLPYADELLFLNSSEKANS